MKIAPRQIASFLAKPPDKISAILLHGSDSGLRSSRSQQLAALYSDDLDDVFSVTRISGASLGGEPGKIADAAAEIPMFGTRLVLVKASGTELLDACKLLLAKPVRGAMVIIDASDTTTKHAVVKLFESSDIAAAIGCYPDSDGDIRQLAQTIFQQDNVSVDRDGLALISSRLGSDHAATRAELEKLVLLAGPGGTLTVETISEALGDSAVLAVDDVADAVANGHVPALSKALRKAWLEEANCVMIIRGCQTYFNQLGMLGYAVLAGQSPQTAVRGLRPPVHFKLQDAFIRHLKNWQPQRCMDMVNRLQDIEINLKSKTIDDRTLTSQSLLGLCLRAQR
ncbi:MAG: DNA polymerase III subunit delta [Candidatus Puniceispirillaceae bacterium]